MGLDPLFKVPQVQLESVRAAIIKRGLDPDTFAVIATNDLLGPGSFKSVINVTRGGISRKFERTFDSKWVDEFKLELGKGAFETD